jgi:hypothetical protein
MLLFYNNITSRRHLVNKGYETMQTVIILSTWLLVAIVVGVTFGRFCAAANAFDVRIRSILGIESDTLAENLATAEQSVEEAA